MTHRSSLLARGHKVWDTMDRPDEVTTEDVEGADTGDVLASLRADEFERNHAVRWLTGLIARAAELPFSEEECAGIIDEASFILASFTDGNEDEEDHTLTRDFSFATPLSMEPVKISLNDAPLSGTDHTDVGLQSWGASIVFSGLLCASPSSYGIDELPNNASVIELGAGTGLISLALAKMAPLLPSRGIEIVATDYHPAVLQNMEFNVSMNFDGNACGPRAMLLDWSMPPSELQSTADMLFAADVVYAPEHARWLRDCAAHLLKSDGTFWLVVTVRTHGKFEGIPATAEAAFQETMAPRGGRVLKIVEKRMLEKKRGIGRDDETGYMLVKIEWVGV